jgi:hypothetical protein
MGRLRAKEAVDAGGEILIVGEKSSVKSGDTGRRAHASYANEGSG